MKRLSLLIALLLATLWGAPAFSASTQEMLEQGIYLEETVGDLTAANKIYRQIIQDEQARKPAIARALYRLGANYKLLGNKEKSLAILQQLVNQHPQQTQLVTKAQRLIDDMNQQSLVLNPIPWADGEMAVYSYFSPAKSYIGGGSFVISKVQFSGKEVWNLDSHVVTPINQNSTFERSILEQTRFLPLQGKLRSSILDDEDYHFSKDTLTVSFDVKGKREKRTIKTGKPVYDSSQVFHLIRRLQLHEDFSHKVSVFDRYSDKVLELGIAVVDKKEVTVKAGKFDCFELELSYFDGKKKVIREDKLSVANNPSRDIVRYSNDNFSMELDKIKNTLYADTEINHYEDLGLSFVTRSNWSIFDITYAQPGLDLSLSISGPEFKPDAILAVGKLPPEVVVPVEKVVDGDIGVLKSYFQNYTLRKGSLESLTVSGMPARRFIADYLFQGKEMVEYRIYMIGSGNVCWFILRAEKNQFDEVREQFESLYNSLQTT